MQHKSIRIGRLTTKNNVFFAPLAGFSDFAMREICLSYGAGLCFTEMVSCKGLLYGNENTEALLTLAPHETMPAVQIFGNDPEIMRRALESEALAPFPIADVNFGCPMPKIYNNGEGSALLADIPLAEKIISSCAKSGKTITCKIRIGLREGDYVTEDFAKACEGAGASLITVHGRVRDRIYAGEPNYKEIAKAKRAVSIPVIANGGIFRKEDADKMINETGADGVMIARGALERPQIFSEILGTPCPTDKKSLIYRHIDLLKTKYEDRIVAVNFRKQLCYYLKGEPGVTRLKEKIFRLTDTDSLKSEIDAFFSARNENIDPPRQ